MNSTINNSFAQVPFGPVPETAAQVICLVGLGCILFTIYSVVLVILCVYRKDFGHSYYTLTFGLGVSDLLNLFYISLKTLESFFNNYEIDYTIGRLVVISCMGLGWFGSFYLNVVVAVNRLIAITMFRVYPKIFQPLVTRLIVLFCYTVGTCFYLTFCILPNALCLNLDRNVPKVMPAGVNIETFKTLQFVQIVSICILVILIYVVAVSVSVRRLKSLNMNRTKYITEVKMLAQGCLCSIFMCVVGAQMFLGPNVVPGYVTKYFHTFYCGSNPIIYLMLDTKLRQRFFHPVKSLSSFISTNQVTPS